MVAQFLAQIRAAQSEVIAEPNPAAIPDAARAVRTDETSSTIERALGDVRAAGA